MTTRSKNKVLALKARKNVKFEAPISALTKWQPQIKAAVTDDAADADATINIYSMVGDYYGPDDITAVKVAAVLAANPGADVNVNINSPGGDFFEGVSIYNLLAQHDGQVNVRVVGIAASAASLIAMAGDNIQIAPSGFLMIHNAWTMALGNKNDMLATADMLKKFDESMAGIYADASGMDPDEISKMMDGETFLSGQDAVDQGFATSLLQDDDVTLDDSANSEYISALRRADLQLAKAGMPRSERRSLIKELTSKPRAADPAKPSAGKKPETVKFGNALTALLETIKS